MTWIHIPHISSCLQGQGEDSTQQDCSDGELFVQSKKTPTVKRFLSRDRKTESSTPSQSGMTVGHSKESHGVELWISCLRDSLANRGQRCLTVEENPTKGISGRTRSGSFVRLDQTSSFWKMCQLSLPIVQDTSERFSGPWPIAGLMLRGQCWELGTVARLTSGEDYGYSEQYPTPRTSDWKDVGENTNWENLSKRAHLAGRIGGPVHPQFSEWLMGWPIGATDLQPLEMDKFQSWLQLHSNSCFED